MIADINFDNGITVKFSREGSNYLYDLTFIKDSICLGIVQLDIDELCLDTSLPKHITHTWGAMHYILSRYFNKNGIENLQQLRI